MDKDYKLDDIRKKLLNSNDADLIFIGNDFSNHELQLLAKCFDETELLKKDLI